MEQNMMGLHLSCPKGGLLKILCSYKIQKKDTNFSVNHGLREAGSLGCGVKGDVCRLQGSSRVDRGFPSAVQVKAYEELQPATSEVIHAKLAFVASSQDLKTPGRKGLSMESNMSTTIHLSPFLSDQEDVTQRNE